MGFRKKMGKLKNRLIVSFKITIDPVWAFSKIIHDPVYFVILLTPYETGRKIIDDPVSHCPVPYSHKF